MMRKRFTPQFRAEVARELLREDKPMSRIAAERGVAATQLNEWKATASKGLVRLFEDEQRDLERLKATHEEEKAKLYAEIGRLTTQLTWLKKKVGLDSDTQ
jgi:transposase